MPICFPYILLVAFFGIAAYLYQYAKEEQKTWIAYTGVLVFWVFFAFRGYILGDWDVYHDMFESTSFADVFTTSHKDDVKPVEPGFLLLISISRMVWDNFLFFTWLCATINTLLIVWFARKVTGNIPLMLMIYVAFGGLTLSTDLMRNSLSLFIVMNALPLLQQRRMIPYMTLCIVATSFHYSALLAIPLYFLLNRSLNKHIYLAALCIALVLRLAHITFIEVIANMMGLQEKFSIIYTAYIQVYGESTGSIPEAMIYLCIGILAYCYYAKLQECHPLGRILLNALFAYIMAWMLFGEFAELCKRVTMLFGYGMWLTPCLLLKCISIENNKRLLILFFSLICIKYMAGIAPHPDFKYDNILFGADSYEKRLQIHYKHKVQ